MIDNIARKYYCTSCSNSKPSQTQAHRFNHFKDLKNNGNGLIHLKDMVYSKLMHRISTINVELQRL